MTFSPAETLYDSVEQVNTWDDLPPYVQEDLLAWFNCHVQEEADKARLLKLYVEGRFRAWDCPQCGDDENTRVFKADIQDEEWDHFQGSLNQDFSYFGDQDKYTTEYIAAMCDSCRAFA